MAMIYTVYALISSIALPIVVILWLKSRKKENLKKVEDLKNESKD